MLDVTSKSAMSKVKSTGAITANEAVTGLPCRSKNVPYSPTDATPVVIPETVIRAVATSRPISAEIGM